MTKETKTTNKAPTKKAQAKPQETASNAMFIPSTPEQAREKVMDKKKFTTTINAVFNRSLKDREILQGAAIQALLRAFGNENYDYIKMIYNGMQNARSQSDADMFKQWVHKYAPVRYVKIKDGSYSFRKSKEGSFDFEGAYQNPWYKEKMHTDEFVQKILSQQNFDKALLDLIKKYEKAMKNGLEENADAKEVIQERSDMTAIKQKINAIRGILDTTNIANAA